MSEIDEALEILRAKGLRAKRGSKPGTVKYLAHCIHMRDGVTTRWVEIPATKGSVMPIR